MPDFFTVEWSPTRGAAIVRDTNGGEYPYDECDEAAHQLLACGNLARRMNGKQRTDDDPKAKRVDDWAVAMPTLPAYLPRLRSPYLWRRNETKGRWEIGVVTDRHDEVEVPLAYLEDRFLRESTDGEISAAIADISAEYLP